MNNKNRKQKFMRAVQLLAPGDQFIQRAAQGVSAEKLPNFPGSAALEFVVAVQKLREPGNRLALKTTSRPRCASPKPLSIPYAIRIKCAEYWLKLGEAEEALRELETLPRRRWNHPAAIKARVTAVGLLRERAEATLDE
jgi:hypothetical protein